MNELPSCLLVRRRLLVQLHTLGHQSRPLDFLHFVGAHEEVFPAVTRLVTPAALKSSPLYAINALRQSWRYMDETGLARPSVDDPRHHFALLLSPPASPTNMATP